MVLLGEYTIFKGEYEKGTSSNKSMATFSKDEGCHNRGGFGRVTNNEGVLKGSFSLVREVVMLGCCGTQGR